MNKLELLKDARALAVSDGGRRTKWKDKYGEVFFLLVDEKRLTGKAAVDWIVAKEGLGEKDSIKLYRTAMYWKKKRDADQKKKRDADQKKKRDADQKKKRDADQKKKRDADQKEGGNAK